MTTSFRARFPAAAINNLRIFKAGQQGPADWARNEISNLKVGDIVICFNPANLSDPSQVELEASALVLVFNTTNQASPLGVLLTDDFYVIGTTEAIFRERAVAASARGNNFAIVTVPFISTMTEDAKAFVRDMQRWGSGGTRANPMNGLPDPLIAFFACVGSPLPSSPLMNISTMAQALIRRIYAPEITDLSGKFDIVLKSAEQPAQRISSVTVMETPESHPAAAAAQQGPVSTQGPMPAQQAPVSTQGPVPAQQGPASTQGPMPAQQGLASTQEPMPAFDPGAGIADAIIAAANEGPATPTVAGPLPPDASLQQPGSAGLQPASNSNVPLSNPTPPAKSFLPDSILNPPVAKTPPPAFEIPKATPEDTGFLSIRKRLESRLSGRLPKTGAGPSPEAAGPRLEAVSPVVKLVSNIRQQMSIASDNLEYRVSTLKSKMLDRLVSCKHNLSEKEQLSLKALEDLRAQMQIKLDEIATQSKEQLSACASQGTAQVRIFQAQATGKLAETLSQQEQAIAEKTEEAKRKVSESLAATKDELNKTVSRAQHTLRGAVTTTEVNLNQLINICAESMDERIEGFRAQTNILAEGIGLSVESLGEAAKLQAQQSEDEVVKRLETLSEDSLKVLREQSVRAEMECSKLIDKLSRDKLVPTLQDKRKIVVELSAFFHDEFNGVMQELIENKLAEFEPIVRSNADACTTSLQDFKQRWTANLEAHQKDLDEMETMLKERVDEYLGNAKSRVESMQDITRVTDHVLSSPELLRTRDETCLKFDIVAREHISRAYSQTGDKIQSYKQESQDALSEQRKHGEALLRNRGEESRTRIRAAIKTAMQKIQDLQTKYTA